MLRLFVLSCVTALGCVEWAPMSRELPDSQGGAAAEDGESGEAGLGGSNPASAGASGAGATALGGAAGDLGMAGAETGGAVGDVYMKLEAEDASLSNDAFVVSESRASGGFYVEIQDDGSIDFTVDILSPGGYELVITDAVLSEWGNKTNDLYVNGTKVTSFITEPSDVFRPNLGISTFLDAGENVISIRSTWGWVRVDCLELRSTSGDERAVPPSLVNPDASANALRLINYLTEIYGKRILSGQQDLKYVSTVKTITGREPALVGFDMMDYSPSRVARGARGTAAEQALGWWQTRHGVVTFAWHWNAPSKLYDDAGREWWRGFYTNATYFDVAYAMSHPESQDYADILRDIDAIARELQTLEDAGVPVLWRPLHEASGGWFWWGARGAEPYIALWKLIYERLTTYHGLDNLIWVWNGQAASWYPGDEFVDIVSEDIYDGRRNYDPQLGRFSQATRYAGVPKLVALSENGGLVDPDRLALSGAAWSWFCVWSGDEFIANEVWNENSMKQAVYAHQYVISLDELPDLERYPLP